MFHKSHISFPIFQTTAGGRNRREVRKTDIVSPYLPFQQITFGINCSHRAMVFPRKVVLEGKKL